MKKCLENEKEERVKLQGKQEELREMFGKVRDRIENANENVAGFAGNERLHGCDE